MILKYMQEFEIFNPMDKSNTELHCCLLVNVTNNSASIIKMFYAKLL